MMMFGSLQAVVVLLWQMGTMEMPMLSYVQLCQKKHGRG